MFFLIISVIFFFFIFSGTGYGFCYLSRWRIRTNPFMPFFIGFSLIGLYFLAVSIFSPLNIKTLVPVIIVGCFRIFVAIKNKDFRSDFDNKKWFILFLSIILLIIALEFASHDFSSAYDSLLYHANSISWMNAYKAIPGLANLHNRLGMNSIYLSIAAGIDVGIFNRASGFILPCLMFFASFSFFLWELIFAEDKNDRRFSFGVLVWLVFISSFSPNLYYDCPAMIFTAIMLLEIFDIFKKDKEPLIDSLAVIMLFATVSFAIKQLGALNIIFASAFSLYYILKNKSFCFKPIAKILVLPILFAIFYVWRNIIITGYPIFPLPILRFDLPWTVTPEIINSCYTAIKYWAKMPTSLWATVADNNFSYWFIPWLNSAKESSDSIYLIITIPALLFWIKPLFIIKNKQAIFMFLILVSNILFWFFYAPDFRFASILFFLLFFLPFVFNPAEKLEQFASLFLVSIILFTCHSSVPFVLRLAFLFVLIFLLFKRGKFLKQDSFLLFQLTCLGFIFFVRQGLPLNSNLININLIQSCPVYQITLDNNQKPPLRVWTPIKGDQCGDSPLPCTPYINNDLKQLSPGHMQKGFYIDTSNK